MIARSGRSSICRSKCSGELHAKLLLSYFAVDRGTKWFVG